MDAAISVRSLTKQFPHQKKEALKSISADIPKGKIIGIVGPDGAGKTTLIRIIAGLLSFSEGEVKVFGFDAFHEPEKTHQFLSYMPQRFGLYDDLTVQQNLNLYAELQGIDHPMERSRELLSFVGLDPFTKRLAKQLSGGMQQKLGLACALLRKPKLLILDEPTVGIDPISRRQLWSMMEDLLADDISIVWSTSYLDEAEKCHEVLLLNEGGLLFFGPPGNLTDRLEGRTFLIRNLGNRKKEVFQSSILDPEITDSTIQGDAVRIITKHENQPIKIGNEAEIVSVPPRFEDAFVDILGGGPKGSSRLAEKMVPTMQGDHEIVIQAKNLTKRFDSFTAVKDVSFSIPRGEIFGLLGPNGAGKSTTFRMLCGLIKPTEGDAYVKGISLQTAPGEARAKIGYMAQKFSLYGNMTILQNLRFFAGIYPRTTLKRSEAIEELIEIFSFKPYLNMPAGELPLGLKQRLALSCAVVHRPEVLFLDEATSGVDPVTRREFWNHIHGIVSKGCTIMITTHFMDEAEYCDRIGLLSDSRLVAIDSPDALKDRVRSAKLPSPTLEDAFIILTKKP